MKKVIVSKWEEKEGANKLTADGLIRINTNKPEFGSLMLITPNVITITNGFMNKRNVVGFITGRIEDLTATIEAYNLKDGTDYSVAVGESRIATIEITKDEFEKFRSNENHVEPEESGFREKINPTSGEVLSVGGMTIYWKTEVVAEGSSVVDKYVKHDTVSVPAESTDGTEEFDASATSKEKAKAK